ncbi:hypothetical protein [Nitrosopumilus sp.]|uniref:hypothetical protein n=1 Tax=Nitrosopumilus sp. TaxID=2024843 RepID=UPI00292CBFFF|nr:hypothetical protein [Nitrosopumilus sp.]
MTKIMRPKALAVLNPLTVFTAFTETTKIHTTNPIAVTAIRPTLPKQVRSTKIPPLRLHQAT